DVSVNVSNPGLNATAVSDKLKAFANAYNDVVTTIQAQTQQKKVTNPQTTADAVQGVLFADPGLNSLLSNLRNTIGGVFPPGGAAPGDPTLLSQIGLATGAAQTSGFSADSVAGKLTLDGAKLASMIQSNPLGVQRLLGGITSSGGGLAQSISSLL